MVASFVQHGATVPRVRPQSPTGLWSGEVPARSNSVGQAAPRCSPSSTLPTLRTSCSVAGLDCGSNCPMPCSSGKPATTRFELHMDLCEHEHLATSEKLWIQYSHRTPRSNATPHRTPRSVGSAASPRSQWSAAQSTKSFVSFSDLQTQARTSGQNLETELAVLSGLIAEVSVRVTAADAYSSRISSRRPSLSSTAASSPISVVSRQAEPAAAEAANARRAAAPVGARHRKPPRLELHDPAAHLLEELQFMFGKISVAIDKTNNLDLGLKEMAASQPKTHRSSISPRSTSERLQVAQAKERREGLHQKHRATALQRSLRLRLADNHALCSEARSLSARAWHSLIVVEPLELKESCDDQGQVVTRGQCDDEDSASFGIQSLSCALPSSPSLYPDVDDMPLYMGSHGCYTQSQPTELVASWVQEPTRRESTPPLESFLEECRLDSPERLKENIADGEAFENASVVRHVWQVQAVK